MLAELFAVMAPVLAGAGLGFLWVRLGQPYPVDFITRLVFNIGTPALVLASLSGANIDAGTFGQMMLATARCIPTRAIWGCLSCFTLSAAQVLLTVLR